MTPKQKYDERKRLRGERLLRQEQVAADHRQKEQDLEDRIVRFLAAFERIADAMELWADQQADDTTPRLERERTEGEKG